MAISFRDGDSSELADFFYDGRRSRRIPMSIAKSLMRKLDILDAARSENDLKVPPGNRYELLSGNLVGWSSIRVNIQWRLIFRWEDGSVKDLYLDPHNY